MVRRMVDIISSSDVSDSATLIVKYYTDAQLQGRSPQEGKLRQGNAIVRSHRIKGFPRNRIHAGGV